MNPMSKSSRKAERQNVAKYTNAQFLIGKSLVFLSE